ncbi:ion transporter [Joostella atrarenae]|uniref:Ion transporter n=1 Tax=Joostella atrarenae TaxID=679257 RepID=A0ABS9J2I1_9FLAO|nr:ion channel [Joostella atrarenae]MCF8714618.1 ion transporter [Joostella atrarenae]
MVKTLKDIGFGLNATKNVKRFITEDGRFNINHVNKKSMFESTYSYLIRISWISFFSYVLLAYIIINSIFAIGYVAIGVDDISIYKSPNVFANFLNAFLFSAQTITTVGYGVMSPSGTLAGILAALEALIGLLSFSFTTGLLYGRFSKPKTLISFSKNFVVRPFKNKRALMIKVMNTSRNVLIKPKADVILILHKEVNGYFEPEYYNLKLERRSITFLPTTWTIVHEIDEESPFFKLTENNIAQAKAEIVVLFSYYDDAFNNEIYDVKSYLYSDLIIDKKFTKSYGYGEEGAIVLDHSMLDDVEKL